MSWFKCLKFGCLKVLININYSTCTNDWLHPIIIILVHQCPFLSDRKRHSKVFVTDGCHNSMTFLVLKKVWKPFFPSSEQSIHVQIYTQYVQFKPYQPHNKNCSSRKIFGKKAMFTQVFTLLAFSTAANHKIGPVFAFSVNIVKKKNPGKTSHYK